jgi:hypothetical protein
MNSQHSQEGNQKKFRTFEDLDVSQVINGSIRHLRERKVGGEMTLHESSPAFGLTEDELGHILNAPRRLNDSTF